MNLLRKLFRMHPYTRASQSQHANLWIRSRHGHTLVMWDDSGLGVECSVHAAVLEIRRLLGVSVGGKV